MSRFVFDLSFDPDFKKFVFPYSKIPVQLRREEVGLVDIDLDGLVVMDLPDDLIHKLETAYAEIIPVTRRLPGTEARGDNSLQITRFQIIEDLRPRS